MVTVFAAIAAAWLTGMLPLAAYDACMPDWRRVTFLQRLLIYWLWPGVIVICLIHTGKAPPPYALRDGE